MTTDSARVELTGRLGRDPETRYTPAGAMNCSFSMAVTRKWNGRDGQKQERTSWFKVTAWKDLAEQLDRLSQAGELKKGRTVRVVGTLELRDYTTQQGEKRMSADVTAFECEVLDQRGDPVAAGTNSRGMDYSDVPF